MKKITPIHITIKLVKNNNKGETLKEAEPGMGHYTYRRPKERMKATSHQKPDRL